jgi:hypothetical protein
MTECFERKPNIEFLTDPHNLRKGDSVKITNRYDDYESYTGRIYSIVSLPINKHIKPLDSIYTDYIYVKLSNRDYDKIIQRGWDVICNHRPEIISSVEKERGKITKISTRVGMMGESQADINNINAILIWRVGWKIESI